LELFAQEEETRPWRVFTFSTCSSLICSLLVCPQVTFLYKTSYRPVRCTILWKNL